MGWRRISINVNHSLSQSISWKLPGLQVFAFKYKKLNNDNDRFADKKKEFSFEKREWKKENIKKLQKSSNHKFFSQYFLSNYNLKYILKILFRFKYLISFCMLKKFETHFKQHQKNYNKNIKNFRKLWFLFFFI